MITRRGFLTGLAALAGGIALEEAVPVGRVFSFPTNIVIPKTLDVSYDLAAFFLPGDTISFMEDSKLYYVQKMVSLTDKHLLRLTLDPVL